MDRMYLITMFLTLLNLAAWAGIGYLVWLLFKALRIYIRTHERQEQQAAPIRRSLGETIKAHRTRCGMSQEQLAEGLQVSRQAVSKWETGTAEPSTSNLLALAKAFGISPEELLRDLE